MPTILTCAICGGEYTPQRRRTNNKFCSQKCKNKAAVLRRQQNGYENTTSPCNVEGCERLSRWKNGGPCGMHYRRIRLTGDPGPVGAVRGGRQGIVPCIIEGCDRTYFAHGLCNMHYTRKRVTGTAGEAELRRKPIGSGNVYRYLDKSGYVYLTFPDDKKRRILEHRYIMEQHLGRPLWPDETVHHVNGQRADNRLANLELWSSFQPSGQRVEDKIAYAREILARYT